MRTEIKKLQKKIRITTLYITHDQVEAMSMADRIAVMKNGMIQHIGTPDEVYNHSKNTFVGQFIGNPPMNLIKGSVSDKSLHLFSGSVSIPLTDKSLLEKNMPTEFVLGVRPRDIIIAKGANVTAEIRFQGIVTFIEMLGDDTIIEVNVESNNLLVATNTISNNSHPGEKIELGMNIQRYIVSTKKE